MVFLPLTGCWSPQSGGIPSTFTECKSAGRRLKNMSYPSHKLDAKSQIHHDFPSFSYSFSPTYCTLWEEKFAEELFTP